LKPFQQKPEPVFNRHLIGNGHESQSLVFALFSWRPIAAIQAPALAFLPGLRAPDGNHLLHMNLSIIID
jgi:hypothetical protein